MSKYLIRVSSELFVEDEVALKEYIDDRRREWGYDLPHEIDRLEKSGLCTLKDEDGTTTINILEVTE